MNSSSPATSQPTTRLRIGQGYDVHAFQAGDHVMLGGVRIPHSQAVRAHSDGDVLLHALCDALLGAAALGDIGMHFPDSDPRWRGADSRSLLRHVHTLLRARGLRVVNVDATVLADAPRLGRHRDAMCANIAADLEMASDCVNVKATTSERLGFIGREEGLACHAIALLERVDV
jgi:2-C-methyl-D-erythritol 2,4-cyclodiphosphate synthase